VKLSTVNGVETSWTSTRAPKPGQRCSTTSSRPAATRAFIAAYVSPRRIHSVPAHGANPSACANVMISAVCRVAAGSFFDGNDR